MIFQAYITLLRIVIIKMEQQRIIYFYGEPRDRVKAEDIYLNNFEMIPFIVPESGEGFKSVEHYFQSEKYRGYPCEDAEKIRLSVIEASDADICKKLARSYQEADKAAGRYGEHWQKWEERKNDVMIKAIFYKFDQNPEFKKRLLEICDALLIEDSPVDKYWGGAVEGSLNMLGKMLMEYRDSHK